MGRQSVAAFSEPLVSHTFRARCRARSAFSRAHAAWFASVPQFSFVRPNWKHFLDQPVAGKARCSRKAW